jgi:tetratricopeptide (TPR) repeat protein
VRRSLLGTGVAAALLLVSGISAAQPSFWSRARDREIGRANETLVAAERMADYAAEVRTERSLNDFMRAVVAMLELAGVSKLPDPRLRFLYGRALVEIQRDESGRRVLERALAEAPDSPLAARAWFDLAIASARLGDPRRETEAYTRALTLTWDGELRAVLQMNRGESSMVRGKLPEAIADYRAAVRAAGSPDTQALALWGLGVALERYGDLPSALDAVEKAAVIRLPIAGIPNATALDLPSVFFVPAYDLYYYKALGAMASARSAERPDEKKIDLETAIFEWDRYLEQAEPDGHGWVANARRLRARCERDLEKASRELARAPRKKGSPKTPAAPEAPQSY